MAISKVRNQSMVAVFFAAVFFCGVGVSIADDDTAAASDEADEQANVPSDLPTLLPSITPTQGATTQAVICDRIIYPGRWGVCGTTLLRASRISFANYNGCNAYVYSAQLKNFSTRVDGWIVIPPFSEVAYLGGWFLGSDVAVYSWGGNCGLVRFRVTG